MQLRIDETYYRVVTMNLVSPVLTELFTQKLEQRDKLSYHFVVKIFPRGEPVFSAGLSSHHRTFTKTIS